MSVQISQSQLQVLSSINAGDVVSFKSRNSKSFGAKHTVVSITRDTEFDITIITTPVKGRGFQMRTFYPYNLEQTAQEIRKEGN